LQIAIIKIEILKERRAFKLLIRSEFIGGHLVAGREDSFRIGENGEMNTGECLY
jgi:hypothetical protein